MTYKISCYNHKGGVGKTTAAINIAYFLQKSGKKVLTVDCDSQRNSLNFWSNKESGIRIDVTDWNGYKSADSADYDCIVYDLPPALTDEVKEILRQSDMVFIPTRLGEFEISGLADVTSLIGQIDTKLGGIFVTMYKSKTDAEVLEQFREVMGERLMNTLIPDSVTVGESLKCGLTVEEYLDFRKVPNARKSRQIATAYEQLTAEIIERIGA